MDPEAATAQLVVEYLEGRIETYEAEFNSDGRLVAIDDTFLCFNTPEFHYYLNASQVLRMHVTRDKQREAATAEAARKEEEEYRATMNSIRAQYAPSN